MILQQLADHARVRVAQDQSRIPLAQMREAALSLPTGDFPFTQALRTPSLSFICEVKKASPSKGIIDPRFANLDIAKDYEAAGADAISCLTEPRWFHGSDAISSEIRSTVTTPMIRKDFTVAADQI